MLTRCQWLTLFRRWLSQQDQFNRRNQYLLIKNIFYNLRYRASTIPSSHYRLLAPWSSIDLQIYMVYRKMEARKKRSRYCAWNMTHTFYSGKGYINQKFTQRPPKYLHRLKSRPFKGVLKFSHWYEGPSQHSEMLLYLEQLINLIGIEAIDWLILKKQ